jgi:AcrR family transcriptional regulator
MPVSPLRAGPAREAELLRATLDVLRAEGYDRLTVDAVVARAAASKATVYRRWPSKADLVVAAFASAVADAPEPQDRGSLREDLLALLDSLLDELAEIGDIITGLVGELRRNPELAAAMRSGYIDARRQAALDVFLRSRDRGEFTSEVDIELLWQLAPAMLFFRVLLANQPVDREFTQLLVDQVILPLASGTPSAAGTMPNPDRTG